MPLELRHLVIGTVGAMNKHKMTLVIMGGENVLVCTQWPKGRDEGKGVGGSGYCAITWMENRVHVCDVKRRKQPQNSETKG
jgi:hypothetical protein